MLLPLVHFDLESIRGHAEYKHAEKEENRDQKSLQNIKCKDRDIKGAVIVGPVKGVRVSSVFMGGGQARARPCLTTTY